MTSTATAPAPAASVNALIKQAADFFMFSVPNPAALPEPVPLVPFIPQLPYAIKVHESLHRFELTPVEVSGECGFLMKKQIDHQQVATVSMQMTPMPNDFQAAEDRVPPPTLLLPLVSQRFCALKGEMTYDDGQGSGYRAFGTGRTFPAGGLTIALAATLDIIEGYGKFEGLAGTGIVNGLTTPPSEFFFNVLFRVIDPSGNLKTTTPPPPLVNPFDPEPTQGFVALQGEPDPDRPIRVEKSEDGQKLLLHIAEVLRLVDISWEVNPLQSLTRTGQIVGRHTATIVVEKDRLDVPGDVIPAYSQNSEFHFFDAAGDAIGSLKANLAEARIFPTNQPGYGGTICRIGGVAPPISGTGQFLDATGMVSVNGAFSLETGDASILYVIRIDDPRQKFNTAADSV